MFHYSISRVRGDAALASVIKSLLLELGLLLSIWPSNSIGQGPGKLWTHGDKSFWRNSETTWSLHTLCARLPGSKAEEGHS